MWFQKKTGSYDEATTAMIVPFECMLELFLQKVLLDPLLAVLSEFTDK
jgi:hypothetical protein